MSPLAETLTTVATGLVLLFGLVTLPILPGLVIMWIALGVYGLALGFQGGGAWIFGVQTVLMLIGVFIDNVIMGAKAKTNGAAWSSLAIAGVAAFIGTFAIPIPIVGGLLAALGALYLAEYVRLREATLAWQSARALLAGWGWAFVVRFIIGIVMILLWVLWLAF